MSEYYLLTMSSPNEHVWESAIKKKFTTLSIICFWGKIHIPSLSMISYVFYTHYHMKKKRQGMWQKFHYSCLGNFLTAIKSYSNFNNLGNLVANKIHSYYYGCFSFWYCPNIILNTILMSKYISCNVRILSTHYV